MQDIRSAMQSNDIASLASKIKTQYDAYQTGKLSELDIHDLLNAIGRTASDQATALNTWVKEQPESGLAYLTRAYHLRHTGWLMVELNPTPKRAQSAVVMMRAAYDDYQQAEKLLPKCPFCEHGAINIGMFMRSAEMIEDFMADALKDDPKTVVPYLAYGLALKMGLNGKDGYKLLIADLMKNQPENTYLKIVRPSC